MGGESAKAYQRAERKCKELVFSSGEDKKNRDRMSDLAAKLQSKIKTYKQQIEEAEGSLLSTWPSSGRASRSWRRPRRGPSLLPSSKLQTFERTVKIRRKSVRRQFTHFLTFDPRVKIQKSPIVTPKPRSYSSSHLDIALGSLCSSIILPR